MTARIKAFQVAAKLQWQTPATHYVTLRHPNIIFNCNAVCPKIDNKFPKNNSPLNTSVFKILSYNVAGLSNKSIFPSFYNYVCKFDFIFLYETFVTELNITTYENKFSNYKLKSIPAIKSHSRGRASGGHIFGFKKDLNIDCYIETHHTLTYIDMEIDEQKLRLLPTYLNCNHWDKDFEEIQEFMTCGGDNSNLLLIGDFNARMGEEKGIENSLTGIERKSKDKVNNATGNKLLELCDSFGLRILNGTSQGDRNGEYTFVGGQGSSVIDYGLIGGEWNNHVVDFEVLNEPFSDHMPIVVSFTQTDITNNVTENMKLLPKLNWNSNKEQAYKMNLDAALQNHEVTNFNELEDIIILAYPHSRETKKFTMFKEYWFDESCKKARDLSYAWLKIFRKTSSNSIKELYLKANRRFKTLCAKKKKMYFESEARKLSCALNSAEFWNLARNLNDQKYIVNINLSPQVLQNHFQQLLNPTPNDIVKFHYAPPGFYDPMLDSPLTEQEVSLVVDRLKNGKAAGSDRIPVEFYKYGTNNLIQTLTGLMNQVMEDGQIPNQFKEALVFPIYKKGCTMDPANYRGISFLNATYKIFTAVLQSRLKMWIASKNLISEFQAGFRSGYSTIDHIFVFKSIADSFLAKNKKLYVLFVDFRAAFDTVDRDALMYKLYGLGMTLKFGQLIQNIYRDTKSAVWYGADKSDWFETKSGVRQGCALSPDLFALFIDDLVQYLPGGIEFAGLQIKALLFADDVVMMAYSPETLQLMINKLHEYCKRWNLVVNLDKSKVMTIRKGGGRTSSNEKWFYDGKAIEVVKEYKYLGVLFTQNMKMEKHLNEKLVKAKTAINATWKNCFNNKFISHSSKYRVFETVAESILFYAAQVWGCKEYTAVEKLLRFYIKRNFHLSPNSPNYMLLIETGLSPLFIRTLKLQVDYVLRVMQMPENRLPKKVAIQMVRSKKGWFEEWKDLAEDCGMDLNITIDETSTWRPLLYDLIQKVDLRQRKKCEEEAASSLHRTIYNRLDYSLNEKNYFKDEYSVEIISMMFRVRGEMLELNYIPHRSDLPVLCDLCNRGERENIIHFLGCCPVFREIRRSIFGNDILTEEYCIYLLNQMDVMKLYEYLKIALKYRSRIKNEAF